MPIVLTHVYSSSKNACDGSELSRETTDNLLEGHSLDLVWSYISLVLVWSYLHCVAGEVVFFLLPEVAYVT